jgi:hypothetical protein
VEEWVPVVLVIIILVAWIVILGPNLLKRRARSGGDQSITHFHYQLRVLEHSAPEPLVAPAYRLRAVDGSGKPTGINYPDTGTPPVLTVVGAKELPRPALAFLGEPVAEAAVAPPAPPAPAPVTHRADIGVPPTDRYEEAVSSEPRRQATRHWVPTTPPVDLDTPARHADGHARQQARRRRRDTLVVLAGTLACTLLAGIVTGAAIAWAVTLMAAVSLAAYVAVLVHLRRLAEEREAKLHYLDGSDGRRPVRAGGPPTYVSGRYAHPSNQQAVAR